MAFQEFNRIEDLSLCIYLEKNVGHKNVTVGIDLSSQIQFDDTKLLSKKKSFYSIFKVQLKKSGKGREHQHCVVAQALLSIHGAPGSNLRTNEKKND